MYDDDDEKEELIISDDNYMGGNPIVRGTHVTVEQILLDLANDMNMKQIIEKHPGLTIEVIKAAIKFAIESVRYDRVNPRQVVMQSEEE